MSSRAGGDEFILLIKDVTIAQIEDIAKRVLDRVTEVIIINGNKCQVGASIGTSTYPNHGTTIDEFRYRQVEKLHV